MHKDAFKTLLPFPIATVYAELDDARTSPQSKREALFFTGYQLMRTVALTLVGQYFTQELPADVSKKTLEKFNRSLLGVRCPHYKDWIDLLNTLHKNGRELDLDFFPELIRAMEKMALERVNLPENERAYHLDQGRKWQSVTWLEALWGLRNGAAHSGMGRDEVCLSAVESFRATLDSLLGAFSFLTQYELLALRSSLDDERPLIQSLRGATLAEPCERILDDPLYEALAQSPVVMRSPSGRVQPLFPFFHAHIEGEPIRYYDGHFFRNDPKMNRRTIYYLGSGQRFPLDDGDTSQFVKMPIIPPAAETLFQMFFERGIGWKIERKDVAPWTLLDTVNDYARRTLDDLTGVKYLPECFVDRPELGEAIRYVTMSEEPPYRAILVTGRAGSGKTALLADLTCRLLNEKEDHLVLFVRGDGMTVDVDGGNMLLANLLHKMGLDPRDFPTFSEFFNFLSARRSQDKIADRRFVIIADALNEAPNSIQLMREALDMTAVARPHTWLRIVLSAREEFVSMWGRRRGEIESNPFYAVHPFFLPPPEDPNRPTRPEDPPAWVIRPFSATEASEVYDNYQKAKITGNAVPACLTPWDQILPATRETVLSVPLHLDLWMRAFDGCIAPPVSGDVELFEAYVADLRLRFDGFWPAISSILDHLIERGSSVLADSDAHEIEDRWSQSVGMQDRRIRFSPVETACVAGVMQKRTTEEGGGYRITHQRMQEVLLYLRLKDMDPLLKSESVAKWLTLPETEELEGALAIVAGVLWIQGRAVILAQFAATETGVSAFSRAIARRLELGEENVVISAKIRTVVNAISATVAEVEQIGTALIVGIPKKVEGMPVSLGLRALLEASLPWIESMCIQFPDSGVLAQNVGICEEKLGDLLFNSGNSLGAIRGYEKSLEIAEAFYKAEPSSNLAGRLTDSYSKLANVHLVIGNSVRSIEYYNKSLDIAKNLYEAESRRADFARAVTLSYRKLAEAHLLVGDSLQAIELCEKSLQIAETICEADPQATDLANDVSVSCRTLANALHSAAGEGAIEISKKGLAIAERLFNAEPYRSDFLVSIRDSCSTIGDICKSGDDIEQSIAFYERSLEIAEKLFEAEPHRVDFAKGVITLYLKLGDVYLIDEDASRAIQYLVQGYTIAENLYEAEPHRTDLAGDVSSSCLGLGAAWLLVGDIDRASELYMKALYIAEKLFKAEPHRSDFAHLVVHSCFGMNQVAGGAQSKEGREWLSRSRKVLRQLADEGRLPDVLSHVHLGTLEKILEEYSGD